MIGGVSMKNIKLKLFQICSKIETVVYDETVEYYAFLEEQYCKGYRQIIIPSILMVKMIKIFSAIYNLKVYNIEFTEEDEELLEEVNQLIFSIQNNPACVCLLTDKLEFLSNDSSIDIKRISFKGVTKDSSPIDLKIQSNGIVIVNEGATEYAKAIINPIVERGIFG